MTYIRFLAMAASIAAVSLMAEPVDAGGGSWGGGSSGGSGASVGGSSGGSSGGLISRIRSRHAGSYGSSGGSSGGRSWGGGSSGGSWGGSSGGSWGRTGPLRRIAARIHARKSARRSRGSSGGSYGGSSGGYSAGSSGGRVVASSWGGSSGGGSTGSSYSSYSSPVVSSISLGAAAPYESASVSPIVDQPMISQPAMPQSIIGQPVDSMAIPSDTIHGETILDSTQHESAKPAVESDAAMLTVSVPEDAKVTVNEHPTTSDGSVRQFMSQGLKKGYVYTYVVKVVYGADGEEKSESKEVKLRAGETKDVVFDVAEEQADDVETDEPEAADDASEETAETAKPTGDDVVTVVRLHVPANAQVTLAGNPTKGKGVIRTFRTNQLKAGKQWKNYTVRVVADVNGQSVTQERTIDVASGSTNELSFNFGTTGSLAKR